MHPHDSKLKLSATMEDEVADLETPAPPVPEAQASFGMRSTSVTDLSTISTDSQRQRRSRKSRRSRSALSDLSRGRVLAPGAFMGTKEWQITRQQKRGFLGGSQERMLIRPSDELVSVDAEYFCQNPRNNGTLVVKDAATGQAILQCTADGDNKKHTVYGSRPLMAGNRPSNRVGGTQFYPWYQICIGSDGRITVEFFQCRQAQLMYCEESFATAEELHFKSDSFIYATVPAGTISRLRGSDTLHVTILPGTDPAVMIAIALLLPKF